MKGFSESQEQPYKYEDCPEAQYSPAPYSISVSQSATKNVFLKKITFTNGQIDFVTGNRQDMGIGNRNYFLNAPSTLSELPQKVNEIIVRSGNAIVKKAVFVHTYFNPTSTNTYLEQRLKLDELFIYGSDNNNPSKYRFTYNTTTSLPSKESKARDLWGFFNGAHQNTKLIPNTNILSPTGESVVLTTGVDRSPSVTTTKAGILTQVTYPTGGHTSFEYELNKYSILEEAAFDYNKYNSYSVGSLGGKTEETVKVLYKTKLILRGSIYCGTPWMPGGCNRTFAGDAYPIIKMVDAGGYTIFPQYISSYWSRTDQTKNEYSFDQYYDINPGTYIIKAEKYENFHSTFSVRIRNVDDGGSLRTEPTTGKYVDVNTGGLRVTSITGNDGNSNVIKKIIDYTTVKEGLTVSSGVRMAPMKHYYFSVAKAQKASSAGQVCTMYIYNTVFTSESNIPIGSSADGYHVGYSEVKERLVDNNGRTNGYTLYQYENQSEAISPNVVPGTPNITPDGFNGKIKLQAEHNVAGLPVKQLDYNNNKVDQEKSIALKVLRNGASVVALTKYDINSKLVNVSASKETSFTGSEAVEINKSFTYNTSAHLQLIEETITSSKGHPITTTYKYPQDVQLTGNAEQARIKLIAQNRLATVLEQTKSSNSSTEKVINYYKDWGNDLVMLEYVDAGINNNIETKVRYNLYESNGEVLQYAEKQNIPMAYLWGYKNAYPIAEIKNADLGRTEEVKPQTLNYVHSLTQNVNTAVSFGPALELDRDQTISYTFSPSFAGNVSEINFKLSIKDTKGIIKDYQDLFSTSNSTSPKTFSVSLPAGTYTFSYTADLYPIPSTTSDRAMVKVDVNYQSTTVRQRIFHTSFEEEGIENALAKTGKRIYRGSYFFLLPKQAGKYELTYWRKPSTGSNWTYVSETVEITSTSPMHKSLGDTNTDLDEIRFYPVGAQMTTYTYSPLLGLTSVTDVNNRTTYYEYDNAGRLMTIQDDRKNILKKYEYHYVNQ